MHYITLFGRFSRGYGNNDRAQRQGTPVKSPLSLVSPGPTHLYTSFSSLVARGRSTGRPLMKKNWRELSPFTPAVALDTQPLTLAPSPICAWGTFQNTLTEPVKSVCNCFTPLQQGTGYTGQNVENTPMHGSTYGGSESSCKRECSKRRSIALPAHLGPPSCPPPWSPGRPAGCPSGCPLAGWTPVWPGRRCPPGWCTTPWRGC